MKNTRKPKPKAIKELAGYFDNELQSHLPISLLPNGVLAYKNYYVKQLKNGNWGLFALDSKDLVEQFFLRSCALMAAKAHYAVNMEKFLEIKRLDNRYWSNYTDSEIFKHNLKSVKDFDRYEILLTKLVNSNELAKYYKEAISTMFKWTFV